MDRNVSVLGSARHRRRVLAGAGAAALAISSLALVVSPAGAAPGPKPPKGKTTCSTVTGTVAGNIQLTGCVDAAGANTGGSSVPFPTLNLVGGGTITWASGKTTTSGAPTTTPTNAKKCPGYVKTKKKDPPVPEPAALKVETPVTADTSGMKIPGKMKGAVCISADGTTVTALKAFKIN